MAAVNLIIGALLCRPIKRITAYSLIKNKDFSRVPIDFFAVIC